MLPGELQRRMAKARQYDYYRRLDLVCLDGQLIELFVSTQQQKSSTVKSTPPNLDGPWSHMAISCDLADTEPMLGGEFRDVPVATILAIINKHGGVAGDDDP